MFSPNYAGFRGLVGGGVWCGALAVAGLLTLSEPVSARNSDAECRRASLAREALDGDAQFGALNLGVSVRNDVATVWGTVPSAAVAARAVACLARVPGISRVENQLTIESPADPLVDFLKLPARPFVPKSLAEARAAAPTGPKSTRTAHGPVPVWRPERKPRLAESKTTALAAVTMPRIPLPVTRPTPTPLPSTRADDALARSVADLHRQHPQLRDIEPEVRARIVYLRGRVRAWDDLQALARQIALLPGVERVVLDRVGPAQR
jgi:osmotically-inducible protein OsmY